MQLIADLSPGLWVLLAISALLVGVSKTGLPGISTVSIAIFAAILPARESTAAVLLLLIVGDVFALLSYRRHADIPTLLKLIPAVIIGLGAGALFLALADDSWVRRSIGVILLVIIGFTLWRRRSASMNAAGAAARFGYGSLGGFTTMVANAGGPVMSMYFLAARFPVKAFLGTAAWFFAMINLVKVPISISLGLLTIETLLLALMFAPGVVVGAFIGRWIAARIRQQAFDWVVIICTVLGAGYLLVG